MFDFGLGHAIGGGGALALLGALFWLYRTLDNRGAERAKSLYAEQNEQGKQIAALQAKLEAHQTSDNSAFAGIDRKMNSMDSKLDALGSKVDELVGWAKARWGKNGHG